MPIRFEVKMDLKSLSGFVLHHNYMRPGGLIGLVLSVAAIVALIVRWGHWTGMQRCLLIVLALLFLVFQPLMLLKKAGDQLNSGAFKDPMIYNFDENGFSISQGDKSESYDYADIRKTVFHKKVMYLYMTSVSALIIPRSQCGDDFNRIRDMIKTSRKR